MSTSTSAPSCPKVAVVVLTYNQLALTTQCLQFVTALDYPADRLEILVVDNNSSDGTARAIRDRYPTVTVVETGDNLGYAGGNNAGIRTGLEHAADHVLILNNDAVVAPDMLQALVTAAADAPHAGFLGPKVYHFEEPERLQSAGIDLDRCLRSCHRGQDELDAGQYETIQEFPAVSGCAMLVSRQVLDEIGLLDPRFFIYYEEVDWCLRAREAGFRNLYVPAARVWHPKPQLRTANTAFTTYYMTRNQYLLLSKHRQGFRAMAVTTKQNLVWLLNWTFNPKWRHVREKRDALWRALVDATFRRYGRQRYRYGT